MDGIDAALVETDGEGVVNPIAFMFFPYEPDFRPRLRAAMARALEMHAPARDALIDAVEQESTGLHAMADAALVEALLQNLLHNAWKYTAKVPAAHIRVYAEVRDGQRHFCIRDNGAGFDMAHAGKLFQPFQRLHLPHEFSGLGIGLATARRIVLRHGGELRADSAPGQGARFYFTLQPQA